MSDLEKREINKRLDEVAKMFGLKIKLTISNAQKLIAENYARIREIEKSIDERLKTLKKAA